MPDRLVQMAATTRELDKDHTAWTLSVAVIEGAPVCLTVTDRAASSVWHGHVVGGSGLELVIEWEVGSQGPLPGAHPLGVAIDLGERSYTFSTLAGTIADSEAGNRICVVCPEVVTLVERRRQPRAAFQETTIVDMAFDRGNIEYRFEGPLFNLSEGGLACRVVRSTGGDLTVGQTVRVVFSLDDDAETYRITARVANVMPAAEAEQIVVGLEFLDDDEGCETRRRLANLLRDRDHARGTR